MGGDSGEHQHWVLSARWGREDRREKLGERRVGGRGETFVKAGRLYLGWHPSWVVFPGSDAPHSGVGGWGCDRRDTQWM